MRLYELVFVLQKLFLQGIFQGPILYALLKMVLVEKGVPLLRFVAKFGHLVVLLADCVLEVVLGLASRVELHVLGFMHLRGYALVVALSLVVVML